MVHSITAFEGPVKGVLKHEFCAATQLLIDALDPALTHSMDPDPARSSFTSSSVAARGHLERVSAPRRIGAVVVFDAILMHYKPFFTGSGAAFFRASNRSNFLFSDSWRMTRSTTFVLAMPVSILLPTSLAIEDVHSGYAAVADPEMRGNSMISGDFASVDNLPKNVINLLI